MYQKLSGENSGHLAVHAYVEANHGLGRDEACKCYPKAANMYRGSCKSFTTGLAQLTNSMMGEAGATKSYKDGRAEHTNSVMGEAGAKSRATKMVEQVPTL